MEIKKVLILCFLVRSSFQHEHEHISSDNIDHSNHDHHNITKYEVSKHFAQKLINQFGANGALKIPDFEKMLMTLEDFGSSASTNSCIDGLKLLKDIESRTRAAKNLTNTFLVDAEHLMSVCPTLLFHIVSNETISSEKDCEEASETLMEPRHLVWIYSTLALIGISLCGLLGVVVIPIVDKNYYFYVLQYFMALAVGTLTGDALLHLLPHALRPSEGMEKAELLRMMVNRGIAAILGILIFCLIEQILKGITKMKAGKETKPSEEESKQTSPRKHHGHSHSAVDQTSDSMSSIVWMVILGDGLHNFTDGMAIGAAFSNSIAGGFSTTVAVFCHELPHELGDFAVLLKAGMSARKAIYYNILSSVLSFFGMCVGIIIGDTPEATQWIFAAAAGLFIYIALVDMLPELTAPKNEEEGFKLSQLALQLFGMCSGFATMLLIAIYENDLEQIFT